MRGIKRHYFVYNVRSKSEAFSAIDTLCASLLRFSHQTSGRPSGINRAVGLVLPAVVLIGSCSSLFVNSDCANEHYWKLLGQKRLALT